MPFVSKVVKKSYTVGYNIINTGEDIIYTGGDIIIYWWGYINAGGDI